MKRVSALVLAALLSLSGCEADVDAIPGKPDIDIDVKGTPDLDPKTDHDVDVKINTGKSNRGADVDVKVSR